jgi:multidrug efflux pump
MVEDRGDLGPRNLQEAADDLTLTLNGVVIDASGRAVSAPPPGAAAPAGAAGESAPRSQNSGLIKALIGNFSVFRANVPQIFVDVNRKEAMRRGVELKDLFDTLQIYLGSLYVNDFNLFSRTWQVIVQARQDRRNQVDDVDRLKVRARSGDMVPVASVCTIKEQPGPLILTRYNMHPAAPINGNAAPGISSGQAIKLVEQQASVGLPESMAMEWTELAYLELQAGNTAMLVFGFAVVMVFLVLAAQYESWALPLAVILVVPLCLLGAIEGIKLAGQDINIFTQIGFVVLVGLACKNAILIVEFARAKRRSGMTREAATLDACRLRLRPIIMTSMAFILGVVPLTVAYGAGAEMRRTLGTTVFAGMIGVTQFGIFLTPVFFSVIDWIASTPLFHSRVVRWLGRVTIGIFALGYARSLARFAVKAVRQPPPSVPGGTTMQPTTPGVDALRSEEWVDQT